MILIDTSIWIDHLNMPDPRLVDLLKQEEAYGHPHVIGELALGHLKQFEIVVRLIDELPKPKIASDSDVLS